MPGCTKLSSHQCLATLFDELLHAPIVPYEGHEHLRCGSRAVRKKACE
jgi:hypothetical protein